MALGFQVTFDARDPAGLAEFWALALEYQLQPPPAGYSSWYEFAAEIGLPEDEWDRLAAVVDPSGNGPRVLFQRVPEGKTAKNRVHLDINVSGGGVEPGTGRRQVVAEHVERLVSAGATYLTEVDEPTGYCVVLRDPEGNEFCVQ